jgi:hypothetical protein
LTIPQLDAINKYKQKTTQEENKMKTFKQGDWLMVDNGLGSPTLVYLKTDEKNGLGKGWFSAWFYNANYGLDCADWATFHADNYPNYRKLSQSEVDCLPSEVVDVSTPDYRERQFQNLAQEETA